MINYDCTEHNRIYSGYGYTLNLRDVIDPITHSKNLIADITGGELIKLKFLESREELAIVFPNFNITHNLMEIFEKEYEAVKSFIEDFDYLKKNRMTLK